MDIGVFQVKEVILGFPNEKILFTSPQLRALVPTNCTCGFDVIVYVSMSLFVHCRNGREIVKDLASRDIFISEREIGYLGRKFVIYLALALRKAENN